MGFGYLYFLLAIIVCYTHVFPEFEKNRNRFIEKQSDRVNE